MVIPNDGRVSPMTPAADPELDRAMASMCPEGVLMGHRLIQPDDSRNLLPA